MQVLSQVLEPDYALTRSARKTRRPWLLLYKDKSTGRARRRSGPEYGIPTGSRECRERV